MKYKDLITRTLAMWNFARKESLEILDSLDEEKLSFRPEGSPKWQPLYFQFNCMGGTQLVYARAIKEGKMDYSWFHEKGIEDRAKYKTKKELQVFLQKANEEFVKQVRLRRNDQSFLIKWPDFTQLLVNNIASLVGHERLHQGQLISYFTFAGFGLPKGFKSNWAL